MGYAEDWPDHCQKCHGWGGFYTEYDPSPPGVSLSPGTMTDYDPCPECIDKGKCPRCGSENTEEVSKGWYDTVHCKDCNFIEGESDGEME